MHRTAIDLLAAAWVPVPVVRSGELVLLIEPGGRVNRVVEGKEILPEPEDDEAQLQAWKVDEWDDAALPLFGAQVALETWFAPAGGSSRQVKVFGEVLGVKPWGDRYKLRVQVAV